MQYFLFLFLFVTTLLSANETLKPVGEIKASSFNYDIVAKQYILKELDDSGTSGPFELIGENKFIFVTRCGKIHFAKMNDDEVSFIHTGLLPNVDDIFCADLRAKKSLLNMLPNKLLFGVKGIKVDLKKKKLLLHSHSLNSKDCLVVKIFEYPLSEKHPFLGMPKLVYTSDSGFPVGAFAGYDPSNGCPNITSLVPTQAGGGIALDHKNNFYFSIGDMGSYSAPQNIDSSYGKIFKYDGEQVSIYASGSRNSQGLFFDSKSNALYETEHGPKGGDELNLIMKGDNLGWPYSTYGEDYTANGDSHFVRLPGEERWAGHSFGKKPIFSYSPAIAPTSVLIVNDNSMFKDWRGDALISTLKEKSIYRVSLDGGQAVSSEKLINLNSRIRFMVQAEDGTIYAKSDSNIFYEIILDWKKLPQNINIENTVSQCNKCHQYKIVNDGIPNIYGGGEELFVTKLNIIANSSISNKIMQGLVSSLTANEIIKLAEYYNK